MSKFDKIIPKGSVPNCQLQIANCYDNRWFKMLTDRTTLVEELKKEETWVLGRAQEYQEEAFATHISGHNDAAWVTNLFQAAAAAKDLLLPKSS